MSFIALALVLVGAACAFFAKTVLLPGSRAALGFSWISDAMRGHQGMAALPGWLLILSLILCGLAIIDPHYFAERSDLGEHPQLTPSKGIAIYLVLDKSGSMAQPALGRESKIDFMKKVTDTFVKGRSSDLIGIISFARQADVEAPLTLDHDSVRKALASMVLVPSRDLDGTAIGYAIYKAANLMAATRSFNAKDGEQAAFEIENNVIILVTDGLQDPNPLDAGNRLRMMGLDEAARYAKQQGVKLYIVNVDPRLATERFAPQRRQLATVAEFTGGRFYLVDDSINLQEVYSDINRLERTLLPHFDPAELPQFYRRVSFYPWLLAAALVALFGSVVLTTLVVRRVP